MLFWFIGIIGLIFKFSNDNITIAYDNSNYKVFLVINDQDFGFFDYIAINHVDKLTNFPVSFTEYISYFSNFDSLQFRQLSKHSNGYSHQHNPSLSKLSRFFSQIDQEAININGNFLALSRNFLAERSLQPLVEQLSKSYYHKRDLTLLLKDIEKGYSHRIDNVTSEVILKSVILHHWSINSDDDYLGGFNEHVVFSFTDLFVM